MDVFKVCYTGVHSSSVDTHDCGRGGGGGLRSRGVRAKLWTCRLVD